MRSAALSNKRALPWVPRAPVNLWEMIDGPGAGVCTEPPRGWIIPTPIKTDTSTYALTNLLQPGSRIYYVSKADGVAPASGVYYLWNGVNIIDSTGSTTGAGGVAYGTDPMNPTGPIVAWKHWAAVGPTNSGDAPGVRTVDRGAGAAFFYDGTTKRQEAPDWWLFKRGETWDLADDLIDYKTYATSFTATSNLLGTLGGATWRARQVVGAYGSLATARPKIQDRTVSGFIFRTGTGGLVNNNHWRNAQYMDLHFDGSVRDPGKESPSTACIDTRYFDSTSHSVLFQGCLFEKTSGIVPMNGGGEANKGINHFVLHRCAIIDTYGNHVSGVFTGGQGDGSASLLARFQQSDCFWARNGYTPTSPLWQNPEELEAAGTLHDPSHEIALDRNMYIGGELNNAESWIINTMSLRGGSGDQCRGGIRMVGNFHLQGYLTNAGHGGYPDSDGPTGCIVDVVLQKHYRPEGNSHPGWGIQMAFGSNRVEMAGCIVTAVGVSNNQFGLQITACNWGNSGYSYSYPNRNNRAYGNVLESGTAKAVQVEDGIGPNDGGLVGQPAYSAPGVIGNWVKYNAIITSATAPEWQYVQQAGALATNDTDYTGNAIYSSRATAASALSWPAPDASLKTYLVAQGVTVASGSDGVPEMIAKWQAGQRRGDWDERWTNRPLVNYMRRGFGMGVRAHFHR